jgi:hypothetical protein
MAQGRLRKPFTVRRCVSPEPLSAADVARVEWLLARLVAQAWARDHPELFPPVRRGNGDALDARGSGEER